MADLTYGELHRLVDEFLVGSPLKVLDVGCGLGFLSLELAREGHRVLGLDSDQKMIDLANRTMQTDPYQVDRGALEYRLADFASWDGPTGEYDILVVSRVLHHMPLVDKAVVKAANILRKGGRIIVIELAYDRFDAKTAAWLFYLRQSLQQRGWLKHNPDEAVNPKDSVKETLDNWFMEYEDQKCNGFERLRKPLYKHFKQEHFSWKPYLYWDIIAELDIPSNDAELTAARFISNLEKTLIETGEISPVFFCFVGSKL